MELTHGGALFDEPVDDAAVIAILTNDLPFMSEAELAELLMAFFLNGPSVVADALAPLARREIRNRRFIAQVEAIVAEVR